MRMLLRAHSPKSSPGTSATSDSSSSASAKACAESIVRPAGDFRPMQAFMHGKA